jgi:hypothetical protein
MSEFIQKIPLYFNGITQVTADLHKGFSVVFIECWKDIWEPALDRYLKKGRKRPEHAHWDWMKKATVAIMNRKDDNFFWIQYDNATQGIMWVDQSISYFGQDLGEKNIYINFLEVAPWNFFKDKTAGFYKGTGSILLMTAIQYSDSLGFMGRIALESLPQSESFYLNMGMIPVEKDKKQSGLKYFELPTQNAQKILKRMK